MKNILKYTLVAVAIVALSSCFSSKGQHCDAYGKLEIKKTEKTQITNINAKLAVEEEQNS
jgi:hypothetical protein